MSDQLKSRQSQIPGGFRFTIPELNWHAPPFSSFNTIVDAVVQVVTSNQWLAAKNHWPTDRPGIESWVDSYNAAICRANGWYNYLADDTGAAPPKLPAPGLLSKLQAVAGAVRKVESGAEVLLDWEMSGQPPVPQVVADSRAKICKGCKFNGAGDMTDWFTVPASELIRKRIVRLHGFALLTEHDMEIGTCTLCWCPLKLKVWAPNDIVKKHLLPEVKEQLPSYCWMKNL